MGWYQPPWHKRLNKFIFSISLNKFIFLNLEPPVLPFSPFLFGVLERAGGVRHLFGGVHATPPAARVEIDAIFVLADSL